LNNTCKGEREKRKCKTEKRMREGDAASGEEAYMALGMEGSGGGVHACERGPVGEIPLLSSPSSSYLHPRL
jgi:hypothetical protein